MASYKMQKMNPYGREERRKLKCKKCGIIMSDIEPATGRGEFWHPNNGCVNSVKWNTSRGFDHVYDPNKPESPSAHGLVTVVPKKAARARKRGAKSASKHRSRA